MGALDIGKYGYVSGTAGTPSLPPSAKVKRLRAHATSAGTLTINGGSSIPIPAGANWFQLDFGAGELSHPTLVFTGTDSFYVDFLQGF